VKRAGGNVTGDLCCRLAWYNFDDLDLHLREPNGAEIYYHRKVVPSGGQLDVDMNAGFGKTREAVENIFYAAERMLREGQYRLFVHQFAKRESTDVGFEAEIDFKATVHRFTYAKPLKDGETVTVADFTYTRTDGLKILSSLPATTASRKIWNLDTETFHRVNVVTLSPNHWDERGVGNRHYFFFIDGCQNDGTARGFYNEFLRSDLDQHRRVLELVGARVRTEESASQLSGLGFSSTQRNSLVVKVGGSVNRVIRIVF
jgi:hypothetical protein